MTLTEIKMLLVTADQSIRHYFSKSTAKAYSYWEETNRLATDADDSHGEEAWRFYVHRYTKTENDATAKAIFNALDACPDIGVKWTVDYDPDSGYIHHIFECEGY